MELLIVFVLMALNGALVLSEMSIVASRKARLQQWSDEGRPGANIALALANEPGHFLSATQIGITVIGIVSGAFAAETVAKQLAESLAAVGVSRPYVDPLSLVLVVSGIAICSLVLGELVPKRIALLHPEGIARRIARPMRLLTQLAFPLVRAMSVATDGVLRVFGVRSSAPQPVSREEIAVLMRQGAAAGVFDQNEQALVARVFRMDERRVTSVMTPRVDIRSLDLDAPFEANRATLLQSSHSRFPLCKGGLETIVGIVTVKGLLDDALQGRPFDPRLHTGKPAYIPDSLTITGVLAAFRESHSSIGLVVDEYGEIQGLVTMTDVMQALVGDMDTTEETADPDILRRGDGGWLVDGTVSVQRLSEVVGLESAITAAASNGYDTVGGFVLAQLRRMPRPGDWFVAAGYRFEVIDMDHNRVGRLLISPLKAAPSKKT
ncbi:MAG TPA: hemolysin family protein [Burkholderiales bacterium]|nr:hemolysin family protein [Burkholderiales bacterium]